MCSFIRLSFCLCAFCLVHTTPHKACHASPHPYRSRRQDDDMATDLSTTDADEGDELMEAGAGPYRYGGSGGAGTAGPMDLGSPLAVRGLATTNHPLRNSRAQSMTPGGGGGGGPNLLALDSFKPEAAAAGGGGGTGLDLGSQGAHQFSALIQVLQSVADAGVVQPNDAAEAAAADGDPEGGSAAMQQRNLASQQQQHAHYVGGGRAASSGGSAGAVSGRALTAGGGAGDGGAGVDGLATAAQPQRASGRGLARRAAAGVAAATAALAAVEEPSRDRLVSPGGVSSAYYGRHYTSSGGGAGPHHGSANVSGGGAAPSDLTGGGAGPVSRGPSGGGGGSSIHRSMSGLTGLTAPAPVPAGTRGKSQYRGVSWCEKVKKWRALLWDGTKQVRTGHSQGGTVLEHAHHHVSSAHCATHHHSITVAACPCAALSGALRDGPGRRPRLRPRAHRPEGPRRPRCMTTRRRRVGRQAAASDPPARSTR